MIKQNSVLKCIKTYYNGTRNAGVPRRMRIRLVWISLPKPNSTIPGSPVWSFQRKNLNFPKRTLENSTFFYYFRTQWKEIEKTLVVNIRVIQGSGVVFFHQNQLGRNAQPWQKTSIPLYESAGTLNLLEVIPKYIIDFKGWKINIVHIGTCASKLLKKNQPILK